MCNTFPMLRKISFVREQGQKTLVILSRSWPFKGVGVLGDSVIKGKFVTKIFLSDNIE